MVGAHLDSVTAGPGINDNGSGSRGHPGGRAGRRRAPATSPTKHLRFGWWGAEELGLRGSTALRQQPARDRAGEDHAATSTSTWSARRTRATSSTTATTPTASAPAPARPARPQIEQTLEGVLHRRSACPPGAPTSTAAPTTARSSRAGIPAGGIFTGAEGIKTSAQAQLWGGTAGAAFDPCYHRSCDTTTNINDTALDRNADAIAYAVWALSTAAAAEHDGLLGHLRDRRPAGRPPGAAPTPPPPGCWRARRPGRHQLRRAPPSSAPRSAAATTWSPARPRAPSAGANDVDGGVTTIRSPAITLPAGGTLTLSFSWYLAHLNNATSADYLRVSVVSGATATHGLPAARRGHQPGRRLGAGRASPLTSYAGQSVRIRVEAADLATASLVEGAVDDVTDRAELSRARAARVGDWGGHDLPPAGLRRARARPQAAAPPRRPRPPPTGGRPWSSWASRRSGPASCRAHYFGRLTGDPAAMTDLPAAARRAAGRRAAAAAAVGGPARRLRRRRHPQDAVAGHDGALVESVLMRYPDRVTVCMSSQAGCGMACPFCATGQAGLTRNLSTAEIVEQVGRGRPGGPGRRGRRRPAGCPTSSSWAWASRWPTTPGCSPRSAGSPPRRRTGWGCPSARSSCPRSAWCRRSTG